MTKKEQKQMLQNTIINCNKHIYTIIYCNKFIYNTIVSILIFKYNIGMSIRKIKKSYISSTGYFKSYKNNKQIAFESILERDFYMMLEYDNDVDSYSEQPFRLYYELFGKRTRYTPDTLVKYNSGSEKIFEVKYQKDILADIDLQAKLKILKDVIPEQKSLPFEVFTDEHINDTYLKNAKFIYSFAFIPKNIAFTVTIQSLITQHSSGITVKQILEKISSNKSTHLLYIPYIWSEVFQHTNLVNMYQKLTMNTIIQGEIS